MNINYQSPVYLPAGVADIERKIGYVSNADFGIDAIDLSTGNLFWNTNLAAYPLTVWKNSLVALRFLEANEEAAQIVVFSSNQEAAPALLSELIKLPEWITPKINDHFSFNAYLDRNVLILTWNARKMYEGGAPPPDYIVQRESRQDSGKIKIDLITGVVGTLPSGVTGEVINEKKLLPKEGCIEISSWLTNANRANLLLDISSNIPAIYLQKQNALTSQNYHLSKLIEGDGLVTDVSLDGLYVSVHQEIESQKGNRSDDLWLIFSVETGEKIAALDYEHGTKEFSVINSKIFYSVEEQNQAFLKLVLKAKGIENGEVLWEHLLFEKKSFPPPALLQ